MEFQEKDGKFYGRVLSYKKYTEEKGGNTGCIVKIAETN